jgi:hypothetical protein
MPKGGMDFPIIHDGVASFGEGLPDGEVGDEAAGKEESGLAVFLLEEVFQLMISRMVAAEVARGASPLPELRGKAPKNLTNDIIGLQGQVVVGGKVKGGGFRPEGAFGELMEAGL